MDGFGKPKIHFPNTKNRSTKFSIITEIPKKKFGINFTDFYGNFDFGQMIILISDLYTGLFDAISYARLRQITKEIYSFEKLVRS